VVLLFGFEHKHFTMQEAFLFLHSISYRYLFADFELRNLSINNRSVDLYDFSGTGSDSASDADAEFYQIDSGSLSLEGLGVTDTAAVTGFPTAFGTAPPDFAARTVAR
jgi:hypothetical protein